MTFSECTILASFFFQTLNFIVCHSSDGIHLSTDVPDGANIVFVLEEFRGKLFDHLLRQKYR